MTVCADDISVEGAVTGVKVGVQVGVGVNRGDCLTGNKLGVGEGVAAVVPPFVWSATSQVRQSPQQVSE